MPKPATPNLDALPRWDATQENEMDTFATGRFFERNAVHTAYALDLAAARAEDARVAREKTISTLGSILAGGSRERVVVQELVRLKEFFNELAQPTAEPKP